MKTIEILNNGAFVATIIDNELVFGYYHDVYEQNDICRIFEPIAPIDKISNTEIMKYLKQAK